MNQIIPVKCLGVLVASFLGLLPMVSKASVVDQAYAPYVTLGAQARSVDWWGQSFTAHVSGTLDKVGTLIFQEPGVTADMQFSLFPIVDDRALVLSGIQINIPNSLIPVGYGSVGSSSVNDMMTIDLSSYNFQVVVGNSYGMLVHSAIGFNERPMINWLGGCQNNQIVQCGWSNVTSDGYGGGSPLAINDPIGDFQVYQRTDFDFGFATYVSAAAVPEPDTYLLLLSGLGLMGFIARRQKTKQA